MNKFISQNESGLIALFIAFLGLAVLELYMRLRKARKENAILTELLKSEIKEKESWRDNYNSRLNAYLKLRDKLENRFSKSDFNECIGKGKE